LLTDLRHLPDGTVLEADICIIGAGAAGITIAQALAGASLQVMLLESGGTELESEVQALYEGESVGLAYPLDAARLRFLGGTTNHWMGQSHPLDRIDFQKRAWVAHSGWPIGYGELERYLTDAHAICDLGAPIYGPEQLRGTPHEPDAVAPEGLVLRYYRIATPPTRFGEKFRATLERAENITTVLHATVTALATNAPASHVTQADIADVSGKRATARARVFVLACGGIENARVLLLSDQANPAGLGNGSDCVGRFFMEHPELHAADLEAHDFKHIAQRYDTIERGGIRLIAQFQLPPEVQERQGLLNTAAFLVPWMAVRNSGIQSLRRLWWAVRRGRVPDQMTNDLWHVVSDLDGIFGATLGRLSEGAWGTPAEIPLWVTCEPAPTPESRVSLADTVDTLGLRRVRLDWRLSDQELRSAQEVVRHVGMEAGRLRLGRLRLKEWFTAPAPAWPDDLKGGYHHLGTTRMSATPAHGVVDVDCRCHEVDNLFIAGSSVFPTAGCTNPTLNLVALALRLADHLRDVVRT
jgi:choline dehydrogenase-like flavoprotein